MGTYYSIYAEVRVGNKWYNLNPQFERADGKIDVCPVSSGRNWLRETYEESEEDRYGYGRPEDVSQEYIRFSLSQKQKIKRCTPL